MTETSRSELAASGARGGLATLLAQASLLLLRVASLAILARLLAPEIFGTVAIATAIVMFTTQIAFLGLPMSSVRPAELSSAAQSWLLLINTGLGLAMAAVLLTLSSWIAQLYQNPLLGVVLPWLAVVPITAGFQQQFRVRLIRALRFRSLATAEVVASSVAILASIGIALAGGTWQAIVVQLLVQQLVQMSIVMALARHSPALPGRFREEVAPIVRIGAQLSASELLRSLGRYAIVPVTGLFVSPTSLGYFDRAQQLTVMPASLLTDQLQRVVVPILSRVRSTPATYLRFLTSAQRATAYAASFGFLIAAALADPLVTLFLGSDWDQSATIFRFLAVGAAFRAIAQSMQWVFVSGRSSDGLRLNAWLQPTIVAVSLAGVPWGVLGVAAFNALAWLVAWPLTAVFAARSAGVRTGALLSPGLRALLACAPAALIASAALTLPIAPIFILIVGGAWGSLAFGILTILIPTVRKDVREIARIFKLALKPKSR